MEILKGIAVSPGYAIGPAYVVDARDPVFPSRFIQADGVANEVARFQDAIKHAQDELRAMVNRVDAKIGTEAAPIFHAHIAMLADGSLSREILHRIQTQRFTAEYAVHCAIKYFKKLFVQSGNVHLAQRVGDLSDIERGLQNALQGQRLLEFRNLDHPVILVAHDLTPAQTATLDRSRVLGFATDLGGSTGHTAIVARARDIPAVVGLRALAGEVGSGDRLIVDGQRGVVVVNPDAAMIAKYQNLAEAYHNYELRISDGASLPAQTRDGVRVRVMANMEFPDEVAAITQNGAEGVGLFRTEFLYVNRDPNAQHSLEPGEEVQFNAYKETVLALDGRPLTLRTMDLGADKFFHGDPAASADMRNPALGLRAVRYCLHRPDIFRQQLRAVCRASAFGKINMMVPMISTREEVEDVGRILDDVREQLAAEGHDFDADMPVGIMVEVPSVALDIDRFVDICDFFSIGTNDLIQYLLAVDRTNPAVANLYSGAHPSVLRLIKRVLDVGKRADKPVALCGALAAEPEFVVLLLGMGLREFSVSPPMIPGVKNLIRAVSMETAEALADDILGLSSAREVTARLNAFNAELGPRW